MVPGGCVYTDANDRWGGLRCLGQWTSRGGVGSGGVSQIVGSFPVNGLDEVNKRKRGMKLTS